MILVCDFLLEKFFSLTPSMNNNGKEMQKSKMAVWGGLTNSCEEKQKAKEKRKDINI